DCAQTFRDFLRDELAVGENLEVAVRVRREQVQQLRVHERLATKDAEESVAVLLGVSDRAIQRIEINRVLFLDVHPTALATQVAGVDDRKVKERREIFAAFDAPLEFFD